MSKSTWRECTLGDLIGVKHGFAFKSEYFKPAGTHVLLTPGNFHEGGGFKDRGDTTKWYDGPVPADYVLAEGDLIVAMTEQAEGLLGSSALVPQGGRFLHNQRLGRVEILDESQVDRRFLYYLFNTPAVRQQIRASATGTKIRHTAPARIQDVTVRVPQIGMQRRIASILGAYDELIANDRRRVRIIEEMTRTLYREWFVSFRPSRDATRLRVNTAAADLPSGWEYVPFTNLADVRGGGTPSTKVADFWDGEVPFFTPKDAPTGFYVLSTEKHLSERGLSKCASDLYPTDTVFITARGTVGKLALAAVPMAMNQSCYALCGRPGVSQRFLYLATLQQVEYLRTNTGGATFDTIVVDTFRRMKVVRPPTELIASFTRFVDPMFDQIALLERRIENLRVTRDMLLPRLLSGRSQLAVG